MSLAKFEFEGEGKMFPLFTIPVGIFKDSYYEDVKENFISICKKVQEDDPDGRTISNRKGWQSNDSWFFEDFSKELNLYIHNMIEKIFYDSFDHEAELSFTVGNCWININSLHSYNTVHTHPGCDFAGVLYLKVPENNNETPLVFCNKDSHSDVNTFAMYSLNLRNKYGLFAELNFEPSEGTMVIFPSSLPHFVEPNQTEDERISVAFNIRINDYGRFSNKHSRGIKNAEWYDRI